MAAIRGRGDDLQRRHELHPRAVVGHWCGLRIARRGPHPRGIQGRCTARCGNGPRSRPRIATPCRASRRHHDLGGARHRHLHRRDWFPFVPSFLARVPAGVRNGHRHRLVDDLPAEHLGPASADVDAAPQAHAAGKSRQDRTWPLVEIARPPFGRPPQGGRHRRVVAPAHGHRVHATRGGLRRT